MNLRWCATCPGRRSGEVSIWSARRPLGAIISESGLNTGPTCPCGCGQAVRKENRFVPGHDQKAIHERIAQQWGNTVGFIEWFDETYGFKK